MPFYEYACESCNHELETLQKISDDPLVYCPACGENSLKKKISAAGFRLKGTGWYETDFKNNDKKKDKKVDKKADDKTDKKSETTKSSESKSKESSPKSEPSAKSSSSSASSSASAS